MFAGIEKMTEADILNELILLGENYTRHKRRCPGCEDDDLFRINVARVINHTRSGREFLQYAMDGEIADMPTCHRTSYFEALGSTLRLKYVEDVCGALLKLINDYLESTGTDYLAGFPELNNRFVGAGDGHSIKHATHENKINGSYPAMTCIYIQNLRNGLIDLMAMVTNHQSSKPHESPVLKKHLASYAAKHQYIRPLLVYDRALADKECISLMQTAAGKHPWSFVSRLKANMKPVFKHRQQFDRNDPVNDGVSAYYMIGLSNAGTVWLIEYVDPETKIKYSFITNDPTLRPGVVAFLYKIRWKLEKVFDVTKNKLFEQKAWAESLTAKTMQANMTVFTYNFIVLLEAVIGNISGSITKKVEKKRIYYLASRSRKAQKQGRKVATVEFIMPHMHQITCQFIRCIRSWIRRNCPLISFLDVFNKRLSSYI